MKDFDNLSGIWKQQKDVVLPDVSQIIAKAKKEKQTYTQKISVQVTILALTIIALFIVGLSVDFKNYTTFIGLGLMVFCIAIFSGFRLYQIIQLKKIDFNQAPSKTLKSLEDILDLQKLINTKISTGYFVILNIAFAFYFIEVLRPMTLTSKIVVVILYTSWMLFAFFYLGKKQKKKENQRIQEMIDVVKRLENDYDK